ncbi:MAG: M3 family metallopeptidase [Alistipes sp.]|nr:M3 family metallopeptidase [Alistipes sp.]
MTLSSCDKSVKRPSENPLTAEWNTPYGIPPFDEIRDEHYAPALKYAMAQHLAEIDAIATNHDEPTFDNVMLAFDRSGELLSCVSLTFEMICAAEKNDNLTEVEEEMMPLLAAHYDQILMNDALFAKIKTLYDKRGALELDAVQMRLLEKTYNDFVRAGALLSPEQKEQLKAINAELSLTAVKFGSNLLAETNDFELVLSSSELDGLPAGVRDAAADRAKQSGREDKWVFTLHKPSLIPFLTYSTRRDLREQIYKAYLNRGNNGNKHDNKALINDFIRLRTEKAHLLGYECYADYVIADQMAQNKSAVYDLLGEIWVPALERAKSELEEMKTMFRRDNPSAEFASWDWWFYAEKVRRRNYSLDEEMLRPYFALDNVRHGIFFLANRLYGITFRPVKIPAYHKECSAFEVLDKDETLLGVLYFDYFPRDGKGAGAWCGYYREPMYDTEGKRVPPVVSIVCNFTRPVGNTPALLNIDEVGTLFHEFGHALHFLFSDTKYRGLLGVEGDFVELPSQIMENWAFEPALLSEYAMHYRSGDVISKSLVEKLRRSAHFNQGFMTTELVAAALSDLEIHSLNKYEEKIDVEAFEYQVLNEKRGLIPQIEPRYRYTYFSHIFDGGYSAGYYFYIWAEVLDKDAFEAFRESKDIFDRRIAERFRREVLSRGGEDDGMNLYRAFRGANPDKTPLLKARGLWNEPEVEESAEVTPIEENDNSDF